MRSVADYLPPHLLEQMPVWVAKWLQECRPGRRIWIPPAELVHTDPPRIRREFWQALDAGASPGLTYRMVAERHHISTRYVRYCVHGRKRRRRIVNQRTGSSLDKAR